MNRELVLKIFQLAWPIVLQSSLVAVISLADVTMVGSLGTDYMAAVGAAIRWQAAAIILMSGVAAANGMMVAQFWGSSNIIGVLRSHWMSMLLGLILMIPATLCLVFGRSLMLGVATTDPHVIQLGEQYLLTSWPLMLLTLFVIVTESSLRSTGNVRLPLYLAVITILTNVLFNLILINGYLGLPAMGICGAALGTTLARIVQLVLLVLVLHYQRHWLLRARNLQLSWQCWFVYCRQALPLIGSVTTWALGALAYQLIISQLGTDALAVYSVLSPVEGICFSLFFGLTVACSVLIGQALGGDDNAMAELLARTFICFVPIAALLLGLILWLLHQPILILLGLYKHDLGDVALPMFAVICSLFWLKMLARVLINGILRPGGDNHYCLGVELSGMWLVGMPLTALAALSFSLPLYLVYLITFSEELVKCLLCYRRYVSRKWQRNLTHLYHESGTEPSV